MGTIGLWRRGMMGEAFTVCIMQTVGCLAPAQSSCSANIVPSPAWCSRESAQRAGGLGASAGQDRGRASCQPVKAAVGCDAQGQCRVLTSARGTRRLRTCSRGPRDSGSVIHGPSCVTDERGRVGAARALLFWILFQDCCAVWITLHFMQGQGTRPVTGVMAAAARPVASAQGG